MSHKNHKAISANILALQNKLVISVVSKPKEAKVQVEDNLQPPIFSEDVQEIDPMYERVNALPEHFQEQPEGTTKYNPEVSEQVSRRFISSKPVAPEYQSLANQLAQAFSSCGGYFDRKGWPVTGFGPGALPARY